MGDNILKNIVIGVVVFLGALILKGGINALLTFGFIFVVCYLLVPVIYRNKENSTVDEEEESIEENRE